MHPSGAPNAPGIAPNRPKNHFSAGLRTLTSGGFRGGVQSGSRPGGDGSSRRGGKLDWRGVTGQDGLGSLPRTWGPVHTAPRSGGGDRALAGWGATPPLIARAGQRGDRSERTASRRWRDRPCRPCEARRCGEHAVPLSLRTARSDVRRASSPRERSACAMRDLDQQSASPCACLATPRTRGDVARIYVCLEVRARGTQARGRA